MVGIPEFHSQGFSVLLNFLEDELKGLGRELGVVDPRYDDRRFVGEDGELDVVARDEDELVGERREVEVDLSEDEARS